MRERMFRGVEFGFRMSLFHVRRLPIVLGNCGLLPGWNHERA